MKILFNRRSRQLLKLKNKLEEFIPIIDGIDYYSNTVESYINFNKKIEELLKADFKQRDLNNLANNFPELLYLHKEWIPPFDKFNKNGEYKKPEWYDNLEKRYIKIDKLRQNLKSLN